MTKIYFGSTNNDKLKEVKDILGTEVVGVALEIDEVQSLDLDEIATKKAQKYFESLKQPVLVEDQGINFSALNGLPGSYIKDFLKTIGNEGLCRILDPFTSRNAVATTVLAFADKTGQTRLFSGAIQGKIADQPIGTNGFGWDPIFIPDGFTKTFAQMSPEEKNSVSMRRLALEKFKQFLLKN